MKVSLGKFYNEVTGTQTGGRDTIIKALIRWGVPYDEEASKRKGDCVDVSHAEAAKKLYQAEKTARDEKYRKPKKDTAPIDGSIKERVQEMENELKAVKTAVLGLADVVQRTYGMLDAINNQSSDQSNRILARQEDIINRLNNLRRYK